MKWIRKDVFNLTVPIVTEQLFVISLGMINTMMAGHISKEAVSAIGMVDSINNIFIAFFSALAIGGMVVVSQFIGQENIKKSKCHYEASPLFWTYNFFFSNYYNVVIPRFYNCITFWIC